MRYLLVIAIVFVNNSGFFAQYNSEEKVLLEPLYIEASFLGGLNSIRQYVYDNLNVDAIYLSEKELLIAYENDGIAIRTEINFVLNEKGKITDISAVGNNKFLNNEAKKVMKTLKIKCTPAFYKKRPIRTKFKLPVIVTLKLD